MEKPIKVSRKRHCIRYGIRADVIWSVKLPVKIRKVAAFWDPFSERRWVPVKQPFSIGAWLFTGRPVRPGQLVWRVKQPERWLISKNKFKSKRNCDYTLGRFFCWFNASKFNWSNCVQRWPTTMPVKRSKSVLDRQLLLSRSHIDPFLENRWRLEEQRRTLWTGAWELSSWFRQRFRRSGQDDRSHSRRYERNSRLSWWEGSGTVRLQRRSRSISNEYG